jgi:hypothetical protein
VDRWGRWDQWADLDLDRLDQEDKVQKTRAHGVLVFICWAWLS